MRRNAPLFTAAAFSLLGAALAGCRAAATDSSMTDREKQNFKGGPMPASAREEVARRMRQASGQPSPVPPASR